MEPPPRTPEEESVMTVRDKLRRVGGLKLAVALAIMGAAAAAPPVRAEGAAPAHALKVEAGQIADVAPDASGVRSLKGIPFAAPPVGNLRWKAPQPVTAWEGERHATQFGPRCMQSARLGNIDPLNPRMSEDCLYLNIWTLAKSANERLPVMVWIYGGSFNVGAGSEPWYDGTNLAKKGVVVVTLNYRVDVFGFLAHPQLTAESGHGASGNYGFMDQIAALQWVKRNIASFGGDPGAVTIFGESAGSLSVSTLVASPVAKGLFQRAIGQSGAILYPDKSPFALPSLAKAEQAGTSFGAGLAAPSIVELRAKSAEDVLQAAVVNPGGTSVSRLPIIDGYILPASAVEIFSKGQQNDVALLAGSTADEGTLFAARVQPPPTPVSFMEQVRKRFGERSDAVLTVYPANTPEQATASFAALLGDDLISYPTWLWSGLHARTGKGPVYRYSFELRPPAPEASLTPLASSGVFHTAEIVYVWDNLQVREWPWRPEDRRMAQLASSYWVNFAKTGNPNGPGLPDWPAYSGSGDAKVMRFTAEPSSGPDPARSRYEVLDASYRPTPQ